MRASPAVTTEPVTSTAPEPSGSPNASPASARAAAWSIASESRWATLTRSSSKMPSATSARASAAIARAVEFWVQITWARRGSSAASRPSASLSSITPTTPISGAKVNESSSAWARASAPWGLWAASSTIVGLRRTTSSRAGEVTPAKASRTRSASSGWSPAKASTAASARAAFWAWWAPWSGRKTSS